MDPDLVRAAGARPRFDQGSSREALADAHLGGGLLPHPASDVDAGPSPGQWGLDQELVVLGPSSDQRQVATVDGVSPEHRRQRGMGRVVLGHHQESRRSSVQAVHDAGPVFTAPPRQRDPHGQQPVDQRPRPSGRSGVGDQAGRLRHDQEGGILVANVERPGLRSKRPGFRAPHGARGVRRTPGRSRGSRRRGGLQGAPGAHPGAA